jgi:hypothetical protein
MANLFGAAMKKTHKGLGNGKRVMRSMGAAKGNAAGSGMLHDGQPKSMPGKSFKTGHNGNNTKQ